MITSYIFLFGRTPALSLLELRTFFPNLQTLVLTQAALVETDTNPVELIGTLGGTVKIAKVLGTIPALAASHLASFLASEKKSNHLIFGMSRYDGETAVPTKLLSEIKSILEARGIRARFIEARGQSSLSSVVVTKQDVVELVILKKDNMFLVGRTMAVQPFEEWNRRDYGRPFADPKSGMLPPKVARMLVNIARLGALNSGSSEKATLLDPFCGMGTILAEALLTGWSVIGSDQSAEAIEKAERNIRWLADRYPTINSSVGLFVSDATHISDHVTPESVAAIVTEPFMGNARLAVNATTKDMKNILTGLEKLYIGCLRNWHKVLKAGAKVIIALPDYHVGGKTYFVKRVIDSCEMLGYTTLAGPIEYSRPQAVVRRKFFVFQKK